MYKYTPLKRIVRQVKSPKGVINVREFYLRVEAVIDEYAIKGQCRSVVAVILSEDYPVSCYYSNKMLRHVPVRGVMFPVEMFNEELISE